MRNSNTIGVDLAKNVIQVSVVTPANKERSNKELSLAKWYFRQQQAIQTVHGSASSIDIH